MSRTANGRTIAPQANGDPLLKAVSVLRERNKAFRANYSAQQIQQAVEMVRQWEPDHPLLRYHERRMPVSKPGK